MKLAAHKPQYLDADEATTRLGIRKATLYSYVSRKLVRVTGKPGAPRESLYHAGDIASLLAKKQQRRPARAVEHALDFGMPVLTTRISSIEDQRLCYRGMDAIELAEAAHLEDIAALLWPTADGQPAQLHAPAALAGQLRPILQAFGGLTQDRPLAVLPHLLSLDSTRIHARLPEGVAERLVVAVAHALSGLRVDDPCPIHVRLARAWRKPRAADAIRRALVLCADHELNASTFAVRVVASTGAGLTSAVIAGVAALSGPRHGGMTQRVAQLCDSVTSSRQVRSLVRRRLESGEAMAGFDHPLYPDGDPRARALLRHCSADPIVAALCEAAQSIGGLAPNIDVALVALARGFALPREAPLVLFALGRSVGWIAHALEQRAQPQLIRPRARYAT